MSYNRDMNDTACQFVRLRLIARVQPVYLMRILHAGGFEAFPGADPLLTSKGRIVAARSPSLLRRESDRLGLLQGPILPKVLALDIRRCQRALARPPSHWTGVTR